MDWFDVLNDGTRAAVGPTAAAFAAFCDRPQYPVRLCGSAELWTCRLHADGCVRDRHHRRRRGEPVARRGRGGTRSHFARSRARNSHAPLARGLLAIVTISAAEILRLTARSGFAEPLTKGVFGIQQFAGDYLDLNPISDGSYGFSDFRFDERQLWVMVAAWVLVALSALFTWKGGTQPVGKGSASIREDEDAARSLGKNVFGYKIQALMLGGVFGALRASSSRSISRTSTQTPICLSSRSTSSRS